MDEDEPIAGPSGLQREPAESDRGSGSEPESEPGSDGGSEYIEDEDVQEQVQLQPAENEIEGDFECVCSPLPVNGTNSERASGLPLI